MALPKQVKFNFSKEEYSAVFNMTEGKKAKRTTYWMVGILSLVVIFTILFGCWQFVLGCSAVNGQIDYSSLNMAKVDKKALYYAIGLLIVEFITGFAFLKNHKNQTNKLFDIFYDRYHEGIVVMGVESYLFHTEKFEINDLYKKLYEAHENEDFFLLITYEGDEIPVPKQNMDRDTYGKISMLLTEILGQYFIKFGRSNIDITKHTLFGEPDKRKALKK